DEAELEGIPSNREHYRNGAGCCFGCPCRGRGVGDDHCALTLYQVGQQFRQALGLIVCKTVLDRDVLALDVTDTFQMLIKQIRGRAISLPRSGIEPSYPRNG